MAELSQKMLESLTRDAERWHPWDKPVEEWDLLEYSGGKIDDIYHIGGDHAGILVARAVLDDMGIKYTPKRKGEDDA